MSIVQCRDADDVATMVANQLRASIARLQEDPDRVVQVCLTGGRIANRMYQRLACSDTTTVDWKRVEFWWGDERFVPTESPERNAGQTLALLAASIPLDPSKVHPMPAAGGPADINQAAMQYASELGATSFDICLLGMGEDGHVASIFPDHPSMLHQSSAVVAVNEAPKPPPDRLSVTLPVISNSAEVWLIVSGASKAQAVARALAGDESLPAGLVRGRLRTVWFLDEEAASARQA